MIEILKETKRQLQGLSQRFSYRLRGYIDYYYFPFDVSRPLNEHAHKVLLECTQLLRLKNVNYFLCDGTILGIYRDGRLIPHDNDIDVAIFGDFNVDVLKKSFMEMGYSVGRELYFKNKIQQLTIFSKEEVIFDMCFWRDQGDGFAYHYVPEVANGRRQKIHYFKQSSIDYQGMQYFTYSDLEAWLLDQYGETWSIPEDSKGDWRLGLKDII